MTIKILLYAAAAIALFSCVGLVIMKDVNEKLHYLSPPSTVSIFLIAIAIAVREGWSEQTVKAFICAIAIVLMNPVLTHATARAARIREFGQWVSQPHERAEKRQAGD